MSPTDEQLVPGSIPVWELSGWRERFGVTAGITGRGTDPAHPFDLGLWTGSPVGTVMDRWRQFRRSFPQHPGQVLSHQVHGDRVLWHDGAPAGWTIIDGADGHQEEPSRSRRGVTVADCVPIYLLAPAQRTVALLHAGWRGTAAGILARGADLLASRVGARRGDLVMHAGVGICGRCYEVGSEVMVAVGRPADGPGPWHLDLREVLLGQARDLGIADVSASSHCTACEHDKFFSHRASRGNDGRMVAYLGFGQTAGA